MISMPAVMVINKLGGWFNNEENDRIKDVDLILFIFYFVENYFTVFKLVCDYLILKLKIHLYDLFVTDEKCN